MAAIEGRTGWAGLLLSMAMLLALAAPALGDADDGPMGEAEQARRVRSAQFVPHDKYVTPDATPRSSFQILDAGLPGNIANREAGQAISTAVSPDKRTLLILTSGFNLYSLKNGKPAPAASQESVFVYDIGGASPVRKQVLKVPNTFAGIAFAPDGKSFYVSGGKDDVLHAFTLQGGQWVEGTTPVKLGHERGLGFYDSTPPVAAGVAVTADGRRAVVADLYNDSVTVVDLQKGQVAREVQLRPGRLDPAKHGVPGGEYPFWVAIKGSSTAYVSSLRDREVDVVPLDGPARVAARIKVPGNPNKMILNGDGSRLFVAQDNSDQVAVIDTATNKVVDTFKTIAPANVLRGSLARYTGASPNGLALSPDEDTLYVTNGGTNSVAVVRRRGKGWRVAGLVPTGWYPTSVSLSGDGRRMYVVNSKDPAGPNPKLDDPAADQYVYQLEKAGFLSAAVPADGDLDQLTRQVAANNKLSVRDDPADAKVMAALRRRIKHVIYVIKENRTYDQLLGDLDRGNGDPGLTMYGEAITPNFHALARQFVNLDNFYDSGEVSGDGWPWSTSGRETDFGQKAVPLNYAGRGTTYEWEGTERDINTGAATLAERKRLNPKTPNDPDLLPGTLSVADPDGPEGTEAGEGFIWDAAIRGGLSFRTYGCFSDLSVSYPLEPHPFEKKAVQFIPANETLLAHHDPYYRGYDNAYPDFAREEEWEREFAIFEKNGKLPALETVQMPHDHMGSFDSAILGVNTPETQQADNDYATAKLIERVSKSRYKDDTLILVVEDDAQDGPDHVDAHRSTTYVVGPYVKQGAVVSTRYTTVNLVRTIEDVLGIDHLNLNTATARPMADVFDLNQKTWSFEAKPADVLYTTQLPLPPRKAADAAPPSPVRPASWWAERTRGFDFSAEDRVDTGAFNRLLWEGAMGDRPYPTERSGADLRRDRQALLAPGKLASR